MIPFTSTSSRCGGDSCRTNVYGRYLSRTIPILIDSGCCRTGRSRLGGSCASHSMQLLALVMAAAMGMLDFVRQRGRPFLPSAHTVGVCQIRPRADAISRALFCALAISMSFEIPYHLNDPAVFIPQMARRESGTSDNSASAARGNATLTFRRACPVAQRRHAISRYTESRSWKCRRVAQPYPTVFSVEAP